jgi:hypothetical protein
MSIEFKECTYTSGPSGSVVVIIKSPERPLVRIDRTTIRPEDIQDIGNDLWKVEIEMALPIESRHTVDASVQARAKARRTEFMVNSASDRILSSTLQVTDINMDDE